MKKYFSEKNPTTWPMSAKSDTQLPGFILNKDFFGSPIKTFPLQIVELIEKLEGIKKNGVMETHVFELWHFERASHIFIFYMTNILSKTFISYYRHDCPKTFPHSYALLHCLVFYKNAFL